MTTFRRLLHTHPNLPDIIVGCTQCGENVTIDTTWVSSDDDHIVCLDCTRTEDDEDPLNHIRDTREEDERAAFNDRLEAHRREQ